MISRGEEAEGGAGRVQFLIPQPPPTPSYFSLLSCFLNSSQESLMAVEFGQEKSGAGSFRGSGDLCLTKAAPLFVFCPPDREGRREGDQWTVGMKDRGRASESFSSQRLRPHGDADLRQTGHDHLTSQTRDRT